MLIITPLFVSHVFIYIFSRTTLNHHTPTTTAQVRFPIPVRDITKILSTDAFEEVHTLQRCDSHSSGESIVHVWGCVVWSKIFVAVENGISSLLISDILIFSSAFLPLSTLHSPHLSLAQNTNCRRVERGPGPRDHLPRGPAGRESGRPCR